MTSHWCVFNCTMLFYVMLCSMYPMYVPYMVHNVTNISYSMSPIWCSMYPMYLILCPLYGTQCTHCNVPILCHLFWDQIVLLYIILAWPLKKKWWRKSLVIKRMLRCQKVNMSECQLKSRLLYEFTFKGPVSWPSKGMATEENPIQPPMSVPPNPAERPKEEHLNIIIQSVDKRC